MSKLHDDYARLTKEQTARVVAKAGLDYDPDSVPAAERKAFAENEPLILAQLFPLLETIETVHGILSRLDMLEPSTVREVSLVRAAGRCLQFQYATPCGSLATWAELAPYLMGIGNPLDDFRIFRQFVLCVFKTEAQQRADVTAHHIDYALGYGTKPQPLDADGSQHSSPVMRGMRGSDPAWTDVSQDFWDFCASVANGKLAPPPKPAPEPKAAKPSLRGLSKTIYTLLREYTATWIKVDQLRAKAQKTLTSKQSERDRCFDNAMAKLVADGYVWLRKDGTEVSHVGPDESES